MSPYQVVRQGIADLHRLTLLGLGDNSQAQEIRDGLERPLLSMSTGELAKLTRFEDRLVRERPSPVSER